MNKPSNHKLYLFFLSFIVVTLVSAQTRPGPDFSGHVRDANLSPLPHVTVSLIVNETRLSTQTNAEGFYSFQCVPDGSANLNFFLHGFIPMSAGPIQFEYPDSVRWNQILQIDGTFGESLKSEKTLVLRLSDSEGKPISGSLVTVEGVGRGRTDNCGRTSLLVDSRRADSLTTSVAVPGFVDYFLEIVFTSDTDILEYVIVLQTKR